MRELLFKNMTTWDHNKRDVFVEETVEKDGILAKTTRRCLYFIKEKTHIENPEDLNNITKIKFANDQMKRHFHVLKEHDSMRGVDKLMCKVAGTFYTVIDDCLYCIVFIHTFRISFCALRR